MISNEFTFSFAVNKERSDGRAVVRHVIPTTVAAAEIQLQVMDDLESVYYLADTCCAAYLLFCSRLSLTNSTAMVQNDFEVGLVEVKPGEIL